MQEGDGIQKQVCQRQHRQLCKLELSYSHRPLSRTKDGSNQQNLSVLPYPLGK